MKRGRPPKGAPPADSDLPQLIQWWNRATMSTHGITIEPLHITPHALAQRLYAARRVCGHNAYADLKVVEDETKVWIVPR